jgi:hypothetical protein
VPASPASRGMALRYALHMTCYGSQHRRCTKKILSLSEFGYEAEIEAIEADPYSLYE